jgi:hypothetical protein
MQLAIGSVYSSRKHTRLPWHALRHALLLGFKKHFFSEEGRGAIWSRPSRRRRSRTSRRSRSSEFGSSKSQRCCGVPPNGRARGRSRALSAAKAAASIASEQLPSSSRPDPPLTPARATRRTLGGCGSRGRRFHHLRAPLFFLRLLLHFFLRGFHVPCWRQHPLRWFSPAPARSLQIAQLTGAGAGAGDGALALEDLASYPLETWNQSD